MIQVRFYTFFLCVLCFFAKAQVAEFITLQNMNVEDANTYLEKDDWKFEKIKGEEINKLGTLQYKLFSKDEADLVIARLFLYFKGSKIKRLTIGFINSGKYYDYLDELEKLNAKEIVDKSNSLVRTYQNNSHTFIFNLSKEVDESFGFHKYYNLSVLSNDDYKSIKK